MPYGENDNQDQYSHAPVAYGRGEIASQRFQDYQDRLPIHDAIEQLKLQNAQRELELKGQSELNSEHEKAQILRQGQAFYAGLPALQKFISDQVASGKPEYAEGGAAHAAVYANYASEFPYALKHLPDVARSVQQHAEVHDMKAQFDQRLGALRYAQQATMNPGENVKLDAQGVPTVETQKLSVPAETVDQYAKAKSNITFHEQKSLQGQKGATGIYEYPDQPALNADRLQAAVLENRYPELKNLVPIAPAAATPATTPTVRKYNPQTGELE